MSEQQQSVKSPCVGICALDEADQCVACGRTLIEIAEWGVMDDEQRQAVLDRLGDKQASD